MTLNGKRPRDLRVTNVKAIEETLRHRSVGLGESYMNGWWDCDQLGTFFERLFRADLPSRLRTRHLLYALRFKLFSMQTLKRSRQVAREHYDLDNAFFCSMLSMSL